MNTKNAGNVGRPAGSQPADRSHELAIVPYRPPSVNAYNQAAGRDLGAAGKIGFDASLRRVPVEVVEQQITSSGEYAHNEGPFCVRQAPAEINRSEVTRMSDPIGFSPLGKEGLFKGLE